MARISCFARSATRSIRRFQPRFLNIQIGLTVAAILISIIAYLAQRRRERDDESGVSPDYGLLPFWGAVGLSGLLYLELALLALPNAIAGRADTDYTTIAPFVLAATLLPLIPAVRGRARAFIGVFDGNVRGWLWMLLIALLIVFGTRLHGIVAGAALVMAQFFVSMIWWWLVRPRAERQRSFGGLWLIFGVLLFGLLVVGDNFTYEYAFVRDFGGQLRLPEHRHPAAAARLSRLRAAAARCWRSFSPPCP